MIQLIAGGGGDEIGASNLNLLFPDGTIVACDCGARPLNFSTDITLVEDSPPDSDETTIKRNPYPAYSVVSHVDFLILLHGHYDHVGGTIFLVKRNPKIRIFATKVTKLLAEFQWRTTIKIAEFNGGDPPFTEDDIVYALSRFREIPALDEFVDPIALNDNVSIIPIRAGHILGAASCFLSWKGEIVGFVSSDISYADQRTVWGAPKIELPGLGFMVVDSTRLTEKNPPREETEATIIQSMRSHIFAGRSIRILTFSIGRTQEAYAIAREACPKTPIWIDGAGAKISSIYLEELPGRMDPNIESHYVKGREHRGRIIEDDRPSIAILSSAMQFGGVARTYARQEVNKRDRVFMSLGWTDPCSPEHAFFHRSKMYDQIRFGIWEVTRLCQTEHYNLTAHMDGEDVLQMRERMHPDTTVLVHGESDKMDQFIASHPAMGFVKGTNYLPINLV